MPFVATEGRPVTKRLEFPPCTNGHLFKCSQIFRKIAQLARWWCMDWCDIKCDINIKETKCPKGHLESQPILPRTQGQLATIWGPVEGLVETLVRIVKEQIQYQRMRVMAKSLILLWSIYQKAVNLLVKFSHCFALPAVTDGNFQTAIKWLTNKNTTRWTLKQKPGRKFSRVKKAFLHAEGQRGGWYGNSRETK